MGVVGKELTPTPLTPFPPSLPPSHKNIMMMLQLLLIIDLVISIFYTGIAPHKRSSQDTPNRQSSSLPLVWSLERMRSFISDTFPTLDNPEGYDLMFADSNKTVHLIPTEINTPAKLKSYATGRSALYIRQKYPILLAGSSSSSYDAENDGYTTLSASGSHQATTTQTISL